LDPDYFGDEYYDDGEFPSEHRGGSKKLIAAVLIGAVLTGGGLAYLYRTVWQAGPESTKMVEADPSPVKGMPDKVSSSRFPSGNKSIYDRLGSSDSSSDTTDTSDTTASAASTDTQSATGGTLEERIQSALNDAKDLDTPRTVQTMNVRPDGTVEAPQGNIVTPPRPATASDFGDTPQGVVVTSMGSNSQSVTAPAPTPEPEATPVETPAPQPEQSEPMLVQERATPQKPTNVAMLTPQTPAVQSGGTGGVFVQIAARQQQDQALAAYALLQRKYSDQLSNYSPTVRMVDLAEKGRWYRLWVGPLGSKDDAKQLCSDLMTAGLKNCLVRVDN
jgi:cell division septation protein DedD